MRYHITMIMPKGMALHADADTITQALNNISDALRMTADSPGTSICIEHKDLEGENDNDTQETPTK